MQNSKCLKNKKFHQVDNDCDIFWFLSVVYLPKLHIWKSTTPCLAEIKAGVQFLKCGVRSEPKSEKSVNSLDIYGTTLLFLNHYDKILLFDLADANILCNLLPSYIFFALMHTYDGGIIIFCIFLNAMISVIGLWFLRDL